jgi:hypothetical protein
LYRWVEWTDKPWHTITHRDVDRFKQHLQQLRSPQGKLLTPKLSELSSQVLILNKPNERVRVSPKKVKSNSQQGIMSTQF